jgi:hypothetical protein
MSVAYNPQGKLYTLSTLEEEETRQYSLPANM